MEKTRRRSQTASPKDSTCQNTSLPAIQPKEEFGGVPNEIRTRVIAVKGRCPRPLDDGDVIQNLFGGGKRDRTADLLHAMQALSQLSYTPKKRAHYRDTPPPCK